MKCGGGGGGLRGYRREAEIQEGGGDTGGRRGDSGCECGWG